MHKKLVGRTLRRLQDSDADTQREISRLAERAPGAPKGRALCLQVDGSACFEMGSLKKS